jgi:putative FmdB family regulatory protein
LTVPTYEFRCSACGNVVEHYSSISDYVRNPPTYVHCAAPMERFFSVPPGAAIGHVFNDRHYQDLKATDGTDISTRAKHRAYMKAKGLTTADDYTDTWKKQATERAERLAGIDPTRKQDVIEAVRKLGG